jgi:hypothetical protein
MSKYAENTEVSAEKSRAEIEKTLQRYGATGFMYGWEETRAVVAFKMRDRHIKFVLEMPSLKEPQFWRTPGRGLRRSQAQAYAAWEQATRQRWRALALAVKAKLEAVEAKIATFEQEFLSHIVIEDGLTVGEHVIPRVKEIYESGRMMPLLPGLRQLPPASGSDR